MPVDRRSQGSLPVRPYADYLHDRHDGNSDILVVGTMKRIHFTNKDYAKRHHGGYLAPRAVS